MALSPFFVASTVEFDTMPVGSMVAEQWRLGYEVRHSVAYVGATLKTVQCAKAVVFVYVYYVKLHHNSIPITTFEPGSKYITLTEN